LTKVLETMIIYFCSGKCDTFCSEYSFGKEEN